MPHLMANTNAVWSNWVTTSCGTCTTTSVTVWAGWVQGTATATVNDSVWSAWVVNAATSGTSSSADGIWPAWVGSAWHPTTVRQRVPPPLTAEQEAELARDRETERRAAERRRREERKAKERALALLLEHLTEEQEAEYREFSTFRVISADGERVYRVRYGWAGNVELLRPDGSVASRFCIHPRERVPEEDCLLAQKLLLEADEHEFLRIANVTHFPLPAAA